MAGVDDLIAFLCARLDEDEDTALNMLADCRDWTPAGREVWTNGFVLAEASSEFSAGHIARHDPARVLRDVEADRKLLAAYAEGVEFYMRPENIVHPAGELTGLRYAIQCRAERFSDHPDYRQEWKPLDR